MKKEELGEHNLSRLLANMTPTLAEEEYVFITFDQNDRPKLASVPICEFHETEGITLIIPKWEADRSELEYEFHADSSLLMSILASQQLDSSLL